MKSNRIFLSRFALILVGTFALPLLLPAQTPPLPSAPNGPTDRARPDKRGKPAHERDGTTLRGAPLPPPPRRSGDEGENYGKNREKWREMPEEQRQIMRERARELHQMIRREAQNALQQSGLELDEEQAKAFFQQYHQLRRQLEKDLREELQNKREEGIRKIVQQMRESFAPNPPPAERSTPDSPSSSSSSSITSSGDD